MSIIRYESEDRFWKTEDDDGEWVLYKDHIKEIEKLEGEARGAKIKYKGLASEFVDMKRENTELKKVVDIARYVNQLHPPSVYKLIEAMREFDA